MCGRFTLTTNDYRSVAAALGAHIGAEHALAFRARYNIAPSDQHWIVCIEATDAQAREIVPATWGLPPPPGARSNPALAHINARSETAHSRPAFRDAFVRSRCGVIADGFYEWEGPKADRRPCWFHTPDGSPMLFAGLYRDHVDPVTGEVVRRFAIVTTEANALVEPFHDRMPVVLSPDAHGRWLEPSRAETMTKDECEALRHLLTPAPADFLVATPVSKRVNSPRFDDPACIEPRHRPTQQALF
jgi:putative SOS response-associated peptidase YedK